jgi:8-oxo-dGTP pyrophosphatase MutT (NUDIX family)
MYLNDPSLNAALPIPITSLDLKIDPGSWAFADIEKTRIREYWRKLADEKPRIWNGNVLICSRIGIENNVLSGKFIRTDYASFVAWRDWGWPDRSVSNCFGSAAVLTSDGALLYGRMGNHTINSGKLYPPGGSLEMRDVRADGQVDVVGSLTRELEEETGLKASDADKGELLAIFDGQRLSVAQVFRFAASAEVLADQVRRYLASAHDDELSDIEIIRSTSQIDSAIPPYAVALARYLVGAP